MPDARLHSNPTTAMARVEDQPPMERDVRTPAVRSATFGGDFWDEVADEHDWIIPEATVTSDDDDRVSMPLSWFQSYCDPQLQLAPPSDTSPSHSDNLSVSCRQFRPVKTLMFTGSLYLY